jgi:DNA-binding transcriptional LysR family regulator
MTASGNPDRAGVTTLAGPALNSLDTQIAMVEAGEGIAVIPSYGLPACRNRQVVMTRLINPVVNLAFSQLRARGRKLPRPPTTSRHFCRITSRSGPGARECFRTQ